MRICVIAFDWYPFHGRVRRLAEAAEEIGHSVDVICPRQQQEKRFEVYHGVHIYRVPMDRKPGSLLPVSIMRWCWFLFLAGITVTRLHMRKPYQVIHVHNLPDFLVFSALFPRLTGSKIILDVQDISPELMVVRMKGRLRCIVKSLATFQERISTKFANHIITVGEPFARVLYQRGVKEKHLTIITNSADAKLFPPARRPCSPPATRQVGQPFIVMYHGTIEERFGVDTAIRALAIACRSIPEVRLDIQGLGSQLPAIKKLATELGVFDRIKFSEFCPIEKVVDFVVHGDIGIIPYRCDGFADLALPTKALEFAWMHRPMIASNMYGMRSVFRPESVVYCDAACPEQFAAAIVDLYYAPEKRLSMIAAAAEDYTPYQWEIMAQRYRQLLDSLVDSTT